MTSAPLETARQYIDSRRLADAETLLMEFMGMNPSNSEGIYLLGVTFHEQDRLDEAEKVLRKSISLAPRADAFIRVASMLHTQGRLDEARDILTDAVNSLPAERQQFEEIAAIIRMNIDTFKKINAISSADFLPRHQGSDFQASRASIKGADIPVKDSWPTLVDVYGEANYLAAVDRYLFDKMKPPANRKPLSSSTVVAFGSCFAANITSALLAQGAKAVTARIQEEINSTCAVRVLMEHLATGVENDFSSEVRRCYGPLLADFSRDIVHASDFILTMGVAPCFFNIDDGSFFFSTDPDYVRRCRAEGRIAMRTTHVDENVDNIHTILDCFRTMNPEARIFLTLSPVPLGGTAENMTAIEADCISKSVLRAAIYQVQQQRNDLIYWPSFEAVKWFAAHSDVIAFGRQDGRTRHPADWLVAHVVKRFLAYAYNTDH